MKRIVSYCNKEIIYDFTRKRVKNINIRVSGDGTVHVSANRFVPMKEVDQVVLKKAVWILKIYNRIKEQGTNPQRPIRFEAGDKIQLFGEEHTLEIQKALSTGLQVKDNRVILLLKNIEDTEKRRRIFEQEYKMYAQRVFIDSIKRMRPLFHGYNIPMPRIKVRNMKTRWGSCIPKKESITLNLNLLQVPLGCIDYVAAHELTHFLVPNHSKEFYSIFGTVIPDYKARREQLNSLHIDCSAN